MKLIKNSNSLDYQESFVLNVLNEKRNGFYLELGSAWPIKQNNTYLLETVYGWGGIGFEIEKKIAEEYASIRKNKIINANAISFDYKKYFKENNVPNQIDYLQMDLHPAYNTLHALRNLPLDEYRFSVITYEHNVWRGDDLHINIQKESQAILKSYGYFLAIENVEEDNGPFEDWWIDPTAVLYKNYSHIVDKNIHYKDIFIKNNKNRSKNGNN
jgi:hypothetical protein